MGDDHPSPNPDRSSKRLKRNDDGPLTVKDWDFVLHIMYKYRAYREVVALSSTCMALGALRKDAIVKAVFQQIEPGSYFPLLDRLYLMKYTGLPVEKQYRKITQKPWDVPPTQRTNTWKPPPNTSSMCAEFFDVHMRTGYTMHSIGTDLAGLVYCERQLSYGWMSGGWPFRSWVYGQILTMVWNHPDMVAIYDYLVLQIIKPVDFYGKKNHFLVWAYFLSLSRLARARYTLSEHYDFVSLLKKLWRENVFQEENALSALPPIQVSDLAATFAQMEQDDFLDTPGAYIRTLISYLWDIYRRGKKSDLEILSNTLESAFTKYYAFLNRRYVSLNDTRTIPMDNLSMKKFRKFNAFMCECIGEPWMYALHRIQIHPMPAEDPLE